VEQAWKFLLDVSKVILCNVNVGEFGVWTLELSIVQHALVLMDFGLTVCNFCLLLNIVGVAN